MKWLCQTFVHWPYPADVVRRLLPPELTVDTCEGNAWVTFTPFVMADVRPLGALPGAPLLGTFPETNLRTYVRTADGRAGVWFLSLEVTRTAMLAARAVNIPYFLGALRVRRDGDRVLYHGVRYGRGPSYRLGVRHGAAVTPTERDEWLTARWRAFSRRAGVLWESPVDHEPWPLHRCTVDTLRQDLTAAAGLPAPPEAPVVHYSPGVRQVRFAMTRPRLPATGGGANRPARRATSRRARPSPLP